MCLSGLPSKLTSLTQLYGVSHLMSSDWNTVIRMSCTKFKLKNHK
jgi:hypothetical protein